MKMRTQIEKLPAPENYATISRQQNWLFMDTQNTEIMPQLDADIYKVTAATFYTNWLNSNSKAAIEADRELTPTEVLSKLTSMKQADGASLLEVIIAKLVDRALSGDMKAIEKIYDELQHDGVRKHAIASKQQVGLDPALMAVLQQAGIAPSTGADDIVDAEYVDDSDIGDNGAQNTDYAPEAPQMLTEEQILDVLATESKEEKVTAQPSEIDVDELLKI